MYVLAREYKKKHRMEMQWLLCCASARDCVPERKSSINPPAIKKSLDIVLLA